MISNYRIIDFSKIYINNFPLKQTNLFKYFVKILGCDLKTYGFDIPLDLIDLLNKEHFRTKLKITFSLNENILKLKYPHKAKLGIGSLITSEENLKTKIKTNSWYKFSINL